MKKKNSNQLKLKRIMNKKYKLKKIVLIISNQLTNKINLLNKMNLNLVI